MNGISGIVSLIASALTAGMVKNLSQQIEQSNRRPARLGRIGELISRLTGVPSAGSWSQRLGEASPANNARLEKSRSAMVAAMSEQQAVEKKYSHAQRELDEERANPTDKDLDKLQLAVIDLAEELKKATENLHQTTDAHKRLKTETDRQTKWQTERMQRSVRLDLRHPIQSIRGLFRSQLAHNRRQQRSYADRIKQINATGRTRHLTNLRNLVQSKRALAVARRVFSMAPTWANRAKVVASGAKTLASRTRVAGGLVRTYAAVRMAALGARVGAAAGPVGAAIGAAVALSVAKLTAIVGAARAFSERQLHKSEALIDGPIRRNSVYSARVATAMNDFHVQDWKLRQRTAFATSASAEGVVRSTMALKEAQQPRHAAWEDIGNRGQSVANMIAARIEDIWSRIDFLTPVAEAMLDMLERIVGIDEEERRAKKKHEMSVGMQALFALWKSNEKNRGAKAFPPVKKVK